MNIDSEANGSKNSVDVGYKKSFIYTIKIILFLLTVLVVVILALFLDDKYYRYITAVSMGIGGFIASSWHYQLEFLDERFRNPYSKKTRPFPAKIRTKSKFIRVFFTTLSFALTLISLCAVCVLVAWLIK